MFKYLTLLAPFGTHGAPQSNPVTPTFLRVTSLVLTVPQNSQCCLILAIPWYS